MKINGERQSAAEVVISRYLPLSLSVLTYVEKYIDYEFQFDEADQVQIERVTNTIGRKSPRASVDFKI